MTAWSRLAAWLLGLVIWSTAAQGVRLVDADQVHCPASPEPATELALQQLPKAILPNGRLNWSPA
jgi:hypothetical protein